MSTPSVRRARGTVTVVCVALFFGVVTSSGVAVVLPDIATEFDLSAANASWVISGFLLAYGMAIPFYGRLAGRFGSKRLFLFGVAVFAVGSLVCAFAPTVGVLLGARAVQAAGGAAVPGLGMTLATMAVPESARGRALGTIAATLGVGAASGPLLGGVLAEIADWRLLFVATALSVVVVPIGTRVIVGDEASDSTRLDAVGGLGLAAAVAALLYGVTNGGQHGWSDAITVTSLGAFAVLLTATAVHHHRTEDPFVPRELISNATFRILAGLAFLMSGAYLGANLGLPVMFADLHEASSLRIGVALLPTALATAAAGLLAGGAVDRFGASRPMRIGLVSMLVGLLTIALVAPTSMTVVALVAVPLGVGYSLAYTPVSVAVSGAVSTALRANALSLLSMALFVGGSVGAATFTSVAGDGGVDGQAYRGAFLALSIPLGLAIALALRFHRTSTGQAHVVR
ncbi:MAG: MFS transporter, partial [Actinomycetota bacterium]